MTKIKDIYLDDATEEFPDGVIAYPGSPAFSLEDARKRTKVLNNVELAPSSIDRVLQDTNRLIGTNKFNPSHYPIDIKLTASREEVDRQFVVDIQIEPDTHIVLSNLSYTRQDTSDQPDITPLLFKVDSLITVGLIQEDNSTMRTDRISSIAKKLGLRLVSTDDNRILLNNEMKADKQLTRNDIDWLKNAIKRRLGIVAN